MSYVLSPLAVAAKKVRIDDCDRKSSEAIEGKIEENSFSVFRGDRKGFMKNEYKKEDSDAHRFDKNKFYTFEFYQHHIDLKNYSVSGGPKFEVDLKKHLNGNHLQIMATAAKEKDISLILKDNKILWSFDIQHKDNM